MSRYLVESHHTKEECLRELDAFATSLERDMRAAAANLEFERAASIRDRLRRLRSPDPASAGGS